MCWYIVMLCAERLYELPLEVRVYIGSMDIEAYMRMYLWDDEFREYANSEYAMDDFIERFVVKRIGNFKRYELGNYMYDKYDDDGKQRWYMNRFLHRLDGPAVIYPNGNMVWYINGKLHRDGEPAVIHISGYKAYFHQGSRHRLDGPAVMYSDGREEYWEYDKRIYK